MTAVTIRPTFKRDSRPDNGLEAVGDEMQTNRTKVFRVVGLVKYAGASVSEDGEITPAARFLSLEVVGEDDADEHERMLDGRRKERGLGIAKDIPSAGQVAGQAEFDFDEPAAEGDVETNASGEPVPPPSGEEVMAERAEAKASVPAATFTGGADQ